VKPSVEQIGNLLALKRDERPEEGYWQDFLCEFHQSQREQAVKQSGLMSFVGRASEWFSDLGPAKWAYGAGLAYAALMLSFVLTPREAGKEGTPATPVSYQVVPPPAPTKVEQLNQLDLSPSTQGSAGEQIF
jgi:hypothetical protein